MAFYDEAKKTWKMRIERILRRHNNNFRKSLDPSDADYLFDSQINTAKDVVEQLFRQTTRRNHVILVAKMQSGKTGVCNAVVNIITQTNLDEHLMINKYMFVTGMNDCGLKEQTLKRVKSQIIGANRDNIYTGKRSKKNLSENKFFVMKNSDLLAYDGDIDNTIIFIDEAHYGSNEENVLSKFLYKHGIDWKNKDDLISRNIYIVSVSATPFDEIVSDTIQCKKIVELTPSTEYVGVSEFLKNGMVYNSEYSDIEEDGYIFDYIEDAYQRMCNDHVAGVVIIRTRKFDIIKNNDFVKDNFDVYEMYSAGTNIEYDELNKTINKLIRRNDINTLLSKNKTALSKNITDIAELETKPLLVLIKGAFRAGITINDSHKDYIYMVYDHSLKADTTAQALLGRMCGYRKENSPIERTKIYVNMKFASMYSDWENDFQNRGIVPCSKMKYQWVSNDFIGNTEIGSRSRGNFTIDLSDKEILEIYKDSQKKKVKYMEKKFPEILASHGISFSYDYIGEAVLRGKNHYYPSTQRKRFDAFSETATPYEFRPCKIKRFVNDKKRNYLTKDDLGTSAVYLVLDAEISDDGKTIKGNKRLIVYNVEVAQKIKVPNLKSLYRKHKDTNVQTLALMAS